MCCMYGYVRSCCVKRNILTCIYMSFCLSLRLFMSSHVYARAIFLSFPSSRYSRLGSSGGWDAPTGVLTKESLWFKGLLNELCVLSKNVIIYSNSQSTIHLCKNLIFQERTKRIDVRLHFIRDIVSQDIIKFKKVLSKYNHSDMRTKVLSLTNFRSCLTLLKISKGI